MSSVTINDYAKKAYQYYVNAGMTPAGACGMIGNQYSESAGFYANRVEFLCIQRLKENGKTYTDKTYTHAVDTGEISKAGFMNPLPNKQYGYGLSQWTSPSRKSELYDRTVAKGLSIADEDAQLEFTIYELKNKYQSVWNTLTTTNSVKTASDKVLKDFEIPSNWQALSATRADYSQQFYNAFANTIKPTANTSSSVSKNDVIQAVIDIATNEIGYLEKDNSSNLDSKTAGAGSGNYTKYWRDVYPSFQGQAWCAAFVSWVFMKAFGKDTATKLLKHWPYTYCPTMANLFTLNANPKVGDIVIFYRNGVFAHTGIVVSVNGDQFTTIEGNTSGGSTIVANGGGVCKKSYYNSNLPGTKFCTPDWSIVDSVNNVTNNNTASENISTSTTSSTVLRKGSKGSDVAEMQKMLIALGYSCGTYGADGDFGTNTYNALKRFQSDNGLEADGEYGQKSKSKLLSLYNAKQNSVTNSDTNNTFVPYMVRVKIDDLNIRSGAGIDKPLIGKFTGKGTFTIVDEATGKIDSNGKTGKWGLLKSYQSNRNGWICLAYDKYTEKV